MQVSRILTMAALAAAILAKLTLLLEPSIGPFPIPLTVHLSRASVSTAIDERLADLESGPARAFVAQSRRDDARAAAKQLLDVLASTSAEPRLDFPSTLDVFGSSSLPDLAAVERMREQREASARLQEQIATGASLLDARLTEVERGYQLTAWALGAGSFIAACAGLLFARSRWLGVIALAFGAALPCLARAGMAPILGSAPLAIAFAVWASHVSPRGAEVSPPSRPRN